MCPAVQSEVMAAPEFEWLGIFWDAFIRRYRVQLETGLKRQHVIMARRADRWEIAEPTGQGVGVDLLWGQIHRELPNTPSEGGNLKQSVFQILI